MHINKHRHKRTGRGSCFDVRSSKMETTDWLVFCWQKSRSHHTRKRSSLQTELQSLRWQKKEAVMMERKLLAARLHRVTPKWTPKESHPNECNKKKSAVAYPTITMALSIFFAFYVGHTSFSSNTLHTKSHAHRHTQKQIVTVDFLSNHAFQFEYFFFLLPIALLLALKQLPVVATSVIWGQPNGSRRFRISRCHEIWTSVHLRFGC